MSVADLIQFAQGRFGADRPDGVGGQQPIVPNADSLASDDGEELLSEHPAIDRPGVPDWVLVIDDDILESPSEPIELPPSRGRGGFGGTRVITVEGGILAPREPLPDPRSSPAQLPPIDALAYYLPFHFYQYRWGIYLRESGIRQVAATLLAGRAVASPNDAVALASEVLLEHEYFHFMAELACSRGEVALLSHRYAPYFLDRRAAALEEALANARAFRAVRRRWPAAKSILDAWMRSQGPGYSDYARWCSDRAHREGCRAVAGPMLGRAPSRSLPSEFLFEGLRSARSCVPIRLLLDEGSLRIGRPFPKSDGMRIQVYSNDHLPPHFHIELPPGTPYTRYTWPDCEPYPGDRSLTTGERKKLDRYLGRFRSEIDAEIGRVYPNAPTMAAASPRPVGR